MAITEKQKELDVIKWMKSIEMNSDACGTFDYCKYCIKELENPCHMAFDKLGEAQKKVAKKTVARKATSKKTETKKVTAKKAETKKASVKKTESKKVSAKKTTSAKKK